MKTKLGILGTLICSAGLLALPAAAQNRGSYGNYNNQNDGQRYTGNTQVYNQAPSRVTQSYGQHYTGSAQAYTSGYNRTEFRGGDRDDRWDRERDWRRHEHDRRDYRDWR